MTVCRQMQGQFYAGAELLGLLHGALPGNKPVGIGQPDVRSHVRQS